MDSSQRKPSKAQRFFRSYPGMAVMCLVLIGIIQVILILMNVLEYRRERQLQARIEDLGGMCRMDFIGPEWVPQLIQEAVPFFDRITTIETGQINLADPSVLSELLATFKSLPCLGHIGLLGSDFTDAGSEHLKGLKGLKYLQLGFTQITDVSLKSLRGLRRLEHLSLVGTSVTDAGLEHLKELTSLKYLELDGTNITDSGLEHLKGLKSLAELQLDDTATTKEARAKFRQLFPICFIEPNP